MVELLACWGGGSFSRHGQQLYGRHIIVLVVDYLERVKSSKTFHGKNTLVDLKLFFSLSIYYVLFAIHKLPLVQYTSVYMESFCNFQYNSY